MLSQGVPMILHGDEFGRTQQGNNNVYCQDSELSWMDWALATEYADLIQFTAEIVSLRQNHPVFRRRRFFQGGPVGKGDKLGDLAWFTPAGEEMAEQNWEDGFGNTVVVFLNGDALHDHDVDGNRIVDDSFLLIFHAGHEDQYVVLPDGAFGDGWETELDTVDSTVAHFAASARILRPSRSLLVLKRSEGSFLGPETSAGAAVTDSIYRDDLSVSEVAVGLYRSLIGIDPDAQAETVSYVVIGRW
jgi:isoamylase